MRLLKFLNVVHGDPQTAKRLWADAEAGLQRNLIRPYRPAPTRDESSPPIDDLVTLSQVAPLVGRIKRTLERWKMKPGFPKPDECGGGGCADRWYYSRLRAALQSKVNRILPERFPGSRLR